MAESETPQKNNPIDLSSLDGLELGTAWSKSSNEPRPTEDRGERSFRPRAPFDPNRKFDGKPRSFGDRKPADRRGPPGQGFRRNDSREGASFRPAPIEPPTLVITFYPEEAPFKALTKAIKASKRTYELFEITRLILEKPERAVANISQKPVDGKVPPLYVSLNDNSVFLTEAEALQHAAKESLEKFFKAEEVETEAPAGNFVVIHRCGITQKLIGPPNYHRYAALLNEHQAKNLPAMSIAAVQAKIESVKETEVIAQWVNEMKKIIRYTLLVPVEGQPSSFDGADAAIAYLSANHKTLLVKATGQARLTSKQIEVLPKGEIRRSIEAARALQTKFPLETANNLRGRLRRIGFNLYKRGQKGVSYICAVKRRFRTVGQTFAPEVQRVIEFIEKNANVTDADLPKQMLGITPPPPAPADGTPAPASTLTAEEDSAWKTLRQTIQWLVEEGYVVHFGNGKLFVPPARQPNAPKEEGEEEEAAEATTESPEAKEESTTEAKTEESPAVTEAPAVEENKTEEKKEEPKV